MIVIVAGGIGTGKSAVMNILKDLGAEVVFADEINRELLQDNEYIETIGMNFAGVVKNGILNKKMLRNIIFNDENARLKLNDIAHPLIFKRIEKKTRLLSLVFVEIPLLSVSMKYLKYDKICAVKASRDLRARRVSIRDGVSIESALKIIEAQKEEEKIYDLADFIIYNDKDFEHLKNQVLSVYNNVR